LATITFLLFIGILVLIISFSVRNSVGYNIYLYPLYLIIIAIATNQIEQKKYIITVFTIIFISSISEFYLLRDFYGGMFTRENRIFHTCKIDHWKNSENYLTKMQEKRFIPLVSNPRDFLNKYVKEMDEKFFKNYCVQLENVPKINLIKQSQRNIKSSRGVPLPGALDHTSRN
jgi:hypothetical protein